MLFFKPFTGDLENSTLGRISAYSYSRASDSFLKGIQLALFKHGYTEEMAEAFITSKILRCEHDGDWDEKIQKLGERLADKVADSYFSDCKKWTEEEGK